MKTTKILFVMLLMLVMTGCSKDDDQQNPPKMDNPALLGVWTNGDIKTTENLSEAAYFEQNSVLFLYEGAWYHGNYSILDANHFTAKVCKVTRMDFTWFDNYKAFSADPYYYDWVFIYKITGDNLYLERGGRSMNLVKYQ